MKQGETSTMRAGRELDALIAKYVMGLDMVDDTLPQLPKYYLPEYERTIFRDVPLYSSNISDAWEVLEKFPTFQVTRMHDVELPWASEEMYRVIVKANKNVAHAITAPLAICRAALAALGTTESA